MSPRYPEALTTLLGKMELVNNGTAQFKDQIEIGGTHTIGGRTITLERKQISLTPMNALEALCPQIEAYSPLEFCDRAQSIRNLGYAVSTTLLCQAVLRTTSPGIRLTTTGVAICVTNLLTNRAKLVQFYPESYDDKGTEKYAIRTTNPDEIAFSPHPSHYLPCAVGATLVGVGLWKMLKN